MADLALVNANKVDIVGKPAQSLTLAAGVNIVAGQGVMIDPTTGNFVLATTARCFGIATRTARPGVGLTAIRIGIMDGYDLSALAYDADVFLNPVNSNLATTAGTPSVIVGRVVTGQYNLLGRPADKLLLVELH